jgi:hypothetical protein
MAHYKFYMKNGTVDKLLYHHHRNPPDKDSGVEINQD